MRFGRRLTGLHLGEPLNDEERALRADNDFLDDESSDDLSSDQKINDGDDIVEAAD
jgi:hypothetical protein